MLRALARRFLILRCDATCYSLNARVGSRWLGGAGQTVVDHGVVRNCSIAKASIVAGVVRLVSFRSDG